MSSDRTCELVRCRRCRLVSVTKAIRSNVEPMPVYGTVLGFMPRATHALYRLRPSRIRPSGDRWLPHSAAARFD